MIEKYIVIKDKIIIGNFETSQGKSGVELSIAGVDYDEIRKVDINSDHRRKTHIDEYKDNKFKKLSERVKVNPGIIPAGHKLDGEEMRAMNMEEKVDAGLTELSPLQKAVGNNILLKTDEELVSEGIKTQKEIDDEKQIQADEKLIAEEMRKIAISNLGDKLKAVTA